MIAGTQKPMMIEKPIAADVAETQEVYKLVSED
jgi:predicted dehydrogenase